MKLIAVSTVHDSGAAEVARETLRACGIEVELKQMGANPYLGARVEIEVRVPADRVGEAESILAQLAIDAEEAAVRESGAAPADDAEPESYGPRRIPGSGVVRVAVPLLLLGVALIYLWSR